MHLARSPKIRALLKRSFQSFALPLCFIAAISLPVEAGSEVQCTILPLLPGTAEHHAQDPSPLALCDIDFSSSDTAVCPKNWSTSAAALVYTLEGTQWAGRRDAFESQICPTGTHALGEAAREAAVFKHSMNFSDTSGTYAPSILLYDHLSRWLQTAVQVPAAVEFRFASSWYAQRVVQPGLTLAAEHPGRKMLLAAWQHLSDSIDSAAGSNHREFLEGDGTQVWGAGLLFTGRRYGAEINGTRESGWGKGQNYDFQQTAPFLALRTAGDLDTAVATGVQLASADPKMAKALSRSISATQIKWWMLELLEVIFLDYLLGQQDRIGNIDSAWRWLWLDDGELRSASAGETSPPAPGAIKLRTTWLNDNDAGVRNSYANYARSTHMPRDLRHFNPMLYQGLRAFAADMRAGGPVFQAISENYHLSATELTAIARRAEEIDALISADCKAGRYRFDLTAESVLSGANAGASISCD